ncbi:hypothetical protein SAMN05421663_102270 [Terribacillus halophilus]|uniref:Uncharacterized protein n=1 Tax=Terribacillus halophilus TaxID=361279 RepID=A0A1G6L6G8_9BACI|nr:hypothetical protein SAMN05421663_102270 [Terribacillus halophilus]
MNNNVLVLVGFIKFYFIGCEIIKRLVGYVNQNKRGRKPRPLNRPLMKIIQKSNPKVQAHLKRQ